LKVFTTYLLGMSQANCFITHKKLTMYPLGKLPFAPSVRDWLHAYTVLCIEESSLPSLSNPSSLLGAFDEMPECPTPTDDLSTRRHTTFQAPCTASSLAPRATTVNSALLSASCPLPTFSDSGEFPGFVLPTDEFEMDPLPSSDDIENLPLCSHYSNGTFPTSRNKHGFQSLDSLGSAMPFSTSFDDSCPAPGCSGDSLSPAVDFKIDVSSLCPHGSCDIVHASRSDLALPSRVSTLDPTLGFNLAQPLREVSTFNGELSYAMHASTGVLWPADLSPVDDYDAQSEPKPPDPSCASH